MQLEIHVSLEVKSSKSVSKTGRTLPKSKVCVEKVHGFKKSHHRAAHFHLIDRFRPFPKCEASSGLFIETMASRPSQAQQNKKCIRV